MFTGEFYHSIDAKGRVTIPAKFRDILGEKFAVTKGLDDCVWIFSLETWEEFAGKLMELPVAKKEAREFSRFFLSGEADVETDKMGRIILPQSLRDYAGLDGDIAIVGAGSRAEIWNREAWDKESTFDNVDDLAEQLGDLGFGI